jgi:hypothetical protein
MTFKAPRSGRVAWTVAGILAAGFGLRVWALGWGVAGAGYNPDEIPIMNRALALANDLNPRNFLYPSFHFYALFAWEGLFYLIGRIAGLYGSLTAFQMDYFSDPTQIILAGRAFTAVCGTAMIFVVYKLGARLYGAGAGVAAAAFLAVSPFMVRDAHYVKLDVTTTLMNAIAHLALARIVIDPVAAARPRSWVVAGILAGLAISTQYYVLFTVLVIAVVAIGDIRRSGRWQESARLLAWAAAGSIAGFIAGSPFFIVEIPVAMRDIAGVREVDIDRALAAGGGAFTAFWPYLRMLATDAMGAPVFAAAMVGLVYALVTDWRRGLILIGFPLSYVVFISHTVPMSRYLDCVLPMLAVAAGLGAVSIASFFKPRAGLAAAVLVMAAALPGLLISIRSNQFFAQPDTRTLARDFFEREVPPGASVLTQPYSAPIKTSREALIDAIRANIGDERKASVKFQWQMKVSPAPAYRTYIYGDGGMDVDRIYVLPADVQQHGLAALRKHQITHVILKRSNVPNPETAALEAGLRSEADLLATFSPYVPGTDAATQATVSPYFHNTATRIRPELERPGPIVEVWRLR